MIDLSQSSLASPLVHTAATDPGSSWTKDVAVAIDAPPDTDLDPLPEAQWSPQALRSGICGAVSPRVLGLRGAGYRCSSSRIRRRSGFLAGAKASNNSTTRIWGRFPSDEPGG